MGAPAVQPPGAPQTNPHIQIQQPNVMGGVGPQRAHLVEESLIYTSLLKNGLKCFTIYSSDRIHHHRRKKMYVLFCVIFTLQILDHFAAVFTMVDARIFQDVFSLQMPFLFDRMLENQVSIRSLLIDLKEHADNTSTFPCKPWSLSCICRYLTRLSY